MAAIRVQEVLIELRAEAAQLFTVLRGVQESFFQSVQAQRQFQSQVQQLMQQIAATGTQSQQVQQQISNLQQQFLQTEKATEAFSALQFTLQNLNTSLAQLTFVMQRMGTLAAAFGVAASAALGFSLRSAIEFERGMRNVNSLLELSDQQLLELARSVLEVSRQTPQGLDNLVRALYEIASTGFDANEGLVVLREGARAASAGLATVDQAVNAAITALRVYGLSAEDVTRVNDIMFKGVDIGRFTFADLAQQLGDFVGIGAQLGIEFEELIAAMAVMTVRGLNAAEAAVSLSSILRELVKPSVDLENALRGLGFQSAQVAVQQLGLLGLLQRLGQTVGQNQVAWARLFNEARAIRGLTLLMTDNFRGLSDAINEVRNSTGAMARAFEEQQKSVSFQLSVLRNNIQVMAISALQPMLPTVNILVNLFSKVVGAVANLANEFPILTGAIVAATSVLTAFSLALGSFFAILAPIILLLQGQMIPALGALFSRVAALITILRALLSLRTAGIFLGVTAAIQSLNIIAPGATRVLGEVASAYGQFVAQVITGSKKINEAWAGAQTRALSALIAGSLRGFGEFRAEAEEVLSRLSSLAAEIPKATAERAKELSAELERLKPKVDDLGRRMKEAGIPESFVNVQVDRFQRIIDIQLSLARAFSEEPAVRIQRLVSEFQRLSTSLGSEFRAFIKGAARDASDVVDILSQMPKELQNIREGVKQGTIGFDEARNRVRGMQDVIQDLIKSLDRMIVQRPAETALPFLMAKQLLVDMNNEIGRFVSEFARIKPVKLFSEVSVEDIRAIREETERLSESLERSAQVMVSTANLEAATRMQSARTLDQLIFLEEERAKKILEIQSRTNSERLSLIQDAQRRIAQLLGMGQSELASIEADAARARTADEAKALEDRRRAVVDRLTMLNQDFAKLENERTRILVEQNNLRARFIEEGARKVVEIFRTLDEEQRRIITSQAEAIVELTRVQIEAAANVGVQVGKGAFAALVDVIRTEGRRVIEAELDIERERFELRRAMSNLRLELIRSAAEREIAELEAALSRLSSTTQAEMQILDLRQRAFERMADVRIQSIRDEAEAEIARWRASRAPSRFVEAQVAEIQRRAAEREKEIRREVEESRLVAQQRRIQIEIEGERRRIELLRAQADQEVNMAREAGRAREEEAALQFTMRKTEIETELRLREAETQQSIALARLETQSRIAQARFEFETRMALIEAEIRARAAAGQISAQQAAQMLASLAQIRGQFEQFVGVLEQIQAVRESQLLRTLEVERQRAGSILDLLQRQFNTQRELIRLQTDNRIVEIMQRFGTEVDRARNRIRVLEEEFRLIGEEKIAKFGALLQFDVSGIRPQVQAIVDAFDGFMAMVSSSADKVADRLESLTVSVPEIQVEKARFVEPREPVTPGGVVVNVEGTQISLTPDEERLFSELLRKLLGPEGRRVFDQWARRGV